MKNVLTKIPLLAITALLLLSLCACQTDFSKPADYILDVKGGANTFTPELSSIKIPGDSQSIVFEITNTGSDEAGYTLFVSSSGALPLVFRLDTEQADTHGSSAVGTISGGTKHRYILTVSWPVEENSYIYAGQTDKIYVTLQVLKQP